IANMGYQALCLYIDNSFAITRISPLRHYAADGRSERRFTHAWRDYARRR
ncbi:hypothetical protein ACUOFC_38410, partial [Escherichia sp. TWPC-MK]